MGARHKKTRKEKIIADYRHQVYILKNENMPLDKPALAVTVNENSYLNIHILKDVLKTGILTSVIIALQLILLFLLQKHIIMLPIVKY
jgi:hypothetical protein